MSIVKNKDKRTGITYVYESESYWDKEKKQPRAKRRLIGKLDEETGEIVPTDGRGRKRRDQKKMPDGNTTLVAGDFSDYEVRLKEKDSRIEQLMAENRKLAEEKGRFLNEMRHIIAGYESH